MKRKYSIFALAVLLIAAATGCREPSEPPDKGVSAKGVEQEAQETKEALPQYAKELQQAFMAEAKSELKTIDDRLQQLRPRIRKLPEENQIKLAELVGKIEALRREAQSQLDELKNMKPTETSKKQQQITETFKRIEKRYSEATDLLEESGTHAAPSTDSAEDEGAQEQGSE